MGAVDRATGNGWTPLYIACWRGHVDAARLLLDNDAAVDRPNKNGATPLYIACQNGHDAVATLLLDKGAAVDRAREDGWTPLYVACSNGHVAVAMLLLDKGAAVDRAKEDGGTPLSIAKERGHKAIVTLLESKLLESLPPPAPQSGADKCKICLEKEATWSFVHGSTAHLALCEECHNRWSETAHISAQNCPICREPFEKIVKQYR